MGGRGRTASAFLWPLRHGPSVKLLLVAASLLALMLPRETVYISCTKARMSVMSHPIEMSDAFVSSFLEGRDVFK